MTSGKHSNHRKGPDHQRWNDERKISVHGYAKVRVGRNHPLAGPHGYAYEHLLVWVSAGRKQPSDDELIHHRNGYRLDNRIENLELMTRSKHSQMNSSKIKRDEKGRFTYGEVEN